MHLGALSLSLLLHGIKERTGMANAGVVDLYSDFVRLGSFDLNVLNRQIFAGFPSDSSLCSKVRSSSQCGQ